MFVPISLLVILIFCAAVLLLYSAIVRGKIMFYRRLVDETLHKNHEIDNFLSQLSRNLKVFDQLEESMNSTASYVADLVEAQSICIFVTDGNLLRATGVSGAFPPSKNPTSVLSLDPVIFLSHCVGRKSNWGKE